MEEFKDRFRKLRKTLDLTQKAFGERIGMKQNSIALIEMGRNTSDQTIFSICREFHVNEAWLRTGEGDMFDSASTDSSKLDALAEAQGLTDDQYILLQKFIKLKPEIRQGILDYIIDTAAALRATSCSETEYERQARLLREEADAVEQGGGESSASPVSKEA